MTTNKNVPDVDNATRMALIANDRVAGDLVDHIMAEVERLKKPFADLGEFDQGQFVDRLEREAKRAITTACYVIASAKPEFIGGVVKQVALKGNEGAVATVVLGLATNDDLIAAAELSGGACTIVGVTPELYLQGLGEYQVVPDQMSLETGEDDGTEIAKIYDVHSDQHDGKLVGTMICGEPLSSGDIWAFTEGGVDFAFSLMGDKDEDAWFECGHTKVELAELPFFNAQ